LVGDQQVIKISDFGRMKQSYDHCYYKLNSTTRVPLRWLSKEALNEAKYTQASDVFAFGVTLWEVYTYGCQPYAEFSNQQVIEMINEEAPLEMPPFCPSILYGIMIECFHSNAKRRPSFAELHTRLQKWCQSGQTAALIGHQHRASSIHSGGSSAGGGSAVHCGARQPSSATGSSQARGSSMGLLDQFGSSSVPSPAPNSLGNLTSAAQGQLAKLTMLSNGGGIVHSTPIDTRPQKSKIALPNGAKTGMKVGAYPYTDDDDYSTDESG